jgi:hypothetical protein
MTISGELRPVNGIAGLKVSAFSNRAGALVVASSRAPGASVQIGCVAVSGRA